jgi:hypothetical protein
MQFKSWQEFYEKNKDYIFDYGTGYEEYVKMQRRFFEKVNVLKPSPSEDELNKVIEELALKEFENVGDDGLFPNHTDKDIWVAGFIAGIKYKISYGKSNT